MKQVLEYILENAIGNPQIEVSEDERDGVLTFIISSPKEDVGKIIGKSGRTINSIKNILKIIAIKEGKKIEVEVKEQMEGTEPAQI